MQEPSSTKTSDAKTRIVPVSYPKMTVKLPPPFETAAYGSLVTQQRG